MRNLVSLALLVPKISAFIQTEKQTEMFTETYVNKLYVVYLKKVNIPFLW